jgi:pimeloyl-ACP methyl ester carboxylesterase
MNANDILAYLRPRGRRTELVIMMHGYGTKVEEIEGVLAAIGEVKPDADILAPQMPYGGGILGWTCREPAADLVSGVLDVIDRLDAERRSKGERYKSIIVVGHSFGAVLARKIAVIAQGETPGAPFEERLQRFRPPRDWADRVSRVVLLAGMTRGWSVSSAMDWWTAAKWGFSTTLGEILTNGTLTIFSIRQGAPFLIQTRLQWLALMRRPAAEHGAERQPGVHRPDLIVVQLLGTSDDSVSPDDNIDYAVDFALNPGGRSFFYLEVPGTDHRGAIAMTPPPPSKAKEELSIPEARGERLQFALTETAEALARESVPREHMADNLPPEPNMEVDDVVFVIHGIRDKGFWTQKIARAIKKAAPKNGDRVRSFTASYGYFAMAPFMFPWVRRRKVEWLMDRYTEARAHYPKAQFSYVGHSNGTYLLARALRDYPAAVFKHVVLAGSVVRCDYNWKSLFVERPEFAGGRRVERVLNYVATNDWVVALFPKAVQPIPAFDLGSAGHDGFAQADDARVCQIRYVKGTHAAGIKESQWDEIAGFIVNGEPPRSDNPDYDTKQEERLKEWSERSPRLFWGAIGGVLLIGLLLAYWVLVKLGIAGLVAVLAFLAYYQLIKTFITRF